MLHKIENEKQNWLSYFDIQIIIEGKIILPLLTIKCKPNFRRNLIGGTLIRTYSFAEILG